MKIRHLLFFLIPLFLFSPSANSQFATDDFDNNKNYFFTIDTDLVNAPLRLRAVFDHYSKLDLSKRKNRREADKIFVIGSWKNPKTIDEYIKMFSKKFMVFNVMKYKKKDKDCGEETYDITILINPEELESLTIKLNENNRICSVMDHDVRYKRYRFKDLLDSENSKQYWI